MVNYDDQFSIFALHGGAINSEEVLDTNGQIQSIIPFLGNSFGITKDSKVCLGYAPTASTVVCRGAGFDSSSGVGRSVLSSSKGLAQTAGHGLCHTVCTSGNSAGHSSSIGPVTLWTCPASGYGPSDRYKPKHTQSLRRGLPMPRCSSARAIRMCPAPCRRRLPVRPLPSRRRARTCSSTLCCYARPGRR
jgi:hypothetical protein